MKSEASTATPSASAALTTPTTPTAQTAQTFTLFIESVPTGVDVFDGERKIGTTPLQVSIDKEAVVRASATYTLRHPGYQPYSLVQGPSDQNVRLVAALVPELPAAPASAPVEAPAAAAVTPKAAPRPRPLGPTKSAAKATASAPPSDIRMQR
jgi:serine/threonine-protein kinase